MDTPPPSAFSSPQPQTALLTINSAPLLSQTSTAPHSTVENYKSVEPPRNTCHTAQETPLLQEKKQCRGENAGGVTSHHQHQISDNFFAGSKQSGSASGASVSLPNQQQQQHPLLGSNIYTPNRADSSSFLDYLQSPPPPPPPPTTITTTAAARPSGLMSTFSPESPLRSGTPFGFINQIFLEEQDSGVVVVDDDSGCTGSSTSLPSFESIFRPGTAVPTTSGAQDLTIKTRGTMTKTGGVSGGGGGGTGEGSFTRSCRRYR